MEVIPGIFHTALPMEARRAAAAAACTGGVSLAARGEWVCGDGGSCALHRDFAALLVACSDGIETRWKGEVLAPLLSRDPALAAALAAALLMRDHCRGRDDATVAVVRRKD